MYRSETRRVIRRVYASPFVITFLFIAFNPRLTEAQKPSKVADVQIAASPINWSDDDFPILGEETSVITILKEMQEAGYSGTELGNKYPKDPAALKSLLGNYNIQLAAAWHCSYFLENTIEYEKQQFAEFLSFLKKMGTKVAVVAECTYCPFKPNTENVLNQNYPALLEDLFPYQLPELTDDQWEKIGKGYTELAKMAQEAGIKMGYHPHMQTVVQSLPQIERLLKEAPSLNLTIDTGHLAFAGVDVYSFIDKYKDRAVHYHMKNVRPSITELARNQPMSFEWAVINGSFTVPGDGGLDFSRIFKQVVSSGYQGWWVVEAEQNPLTSNPFLYAKLAKEYIRLELNKLTSEQ